MTKILDQMYIGDNLVKMEMNAKDNLDALDQLSVLLFDEGVVNDGFKEAVKKRELEFSTGLQLKHIGVAIPHTDSEYVEKQAIGIGVLNNSVDFCLMGDPKERVPVQIIFMLAIKEPKMQLEFLQALIGIFQDDIQIKRLSQSKSKKEISENFKKMLVSYYEN